MSPGPALNDQLAVVAAARGLLHDLVRTRVCQATPRRRKSLAPLLKAVLMPLHAMEVSAWERHVTELDVRNFLDSETFKASLVPPHPSTAKVSRLTVSNRRYFPKYGGDVFFQCVNFDYAVSV